jgi:hypothetical protein
LRLGILAVSVVAWLVLLIGYFRTWVLLNLYHKKNIEKIQADGIRREAKILNAVKIASPGPGTKATNSVYPLKTYQIQKSYRKPASTTASHMNGVMRPAKK